MRQFHNPATECILGVDLGGTSLRVARVDASGGKILRIPTPSPAEAEKLMPAAFRDAAHGMKVAYVGLSRAPGIDGDGCVCDWPSQPQWIGLPLLRWLHTATHAPVVSADDGVCATLWEHRTNTSSSLDTVTACISIGTGLAIGIMVGDELQPSGDGADTLSHERFGSVDLLCRCGKRGCLQTVLSVWGLENLTASGRLDETRRAFGEFVRALIHRYGVNQVIITGGGVDRFGASFLRHVLAKSVIDQGVNLKISRSPSLSGTGGALLLAVNQLQEQHWWTEGVETLIYRESMCLLEPATELACPAGK